MVKGKALVSKTRLEMVCIQNLALCANYGVAISFVHHQLGCESQWSGWVFSFFFSFLFFPSFFLFDCWTDHLALFQCCWDLEDQIRSVADLVTCNVKCPSGQEPLPTPDLFRSSTWWGARGLLSPGDLPGGFRSFFFFFLSHVQCCFQSQQPSQKNNITPGKSSLTYSETCCDFACVANLGGMRTQNCEMLELASN